MAYDVIEEYSNHCLALVQRQSKLLQRLNKAELVVLANHYGIKDVRFYVEPSDWKYGGKEELCNEIAEIMIGE